MERVVTILVAVVMIGALGLNLLLFAQNQDLRQRIVAVPPTPIASQDPKVKLQEITAELEQYKKDLNKVSNEARTLREKSDNLGNAATERDALKTELDTLKNENAQLKNEVQNLQSMNTINGQVSQMRGLKPRTVVPRTFMNQSQLHDYFSETYDKEYTAEAEAADRTTLQALDMDPGVPSLKEEQVNAMTRSVLGFYSHDTKQLVVVTNRPVMGVKDRITYAHEFTHSLQDQYFDLNHVFEMSNGNSDHVAAIRALIEGDATLTMSLYAQKHLDQFDRINYTLETIADLDPTSMLGGSYGPMTESAVMFPYQEGATFVASLYAAGGWELVDKAYANPPRSTEQVLHPQKYIDGDEPVNLPMPNLANALPNWTRVDDNSLGELSLRIYLEHQISINEAIQAGEGWGGDRYQVIKDDKGRTALALRTVWDTQGDASEFFDAYGEFALMLDPNTSLLRADANAFRWQLSNRQIYLARNGNEVLVLHAPDAATMDTLIAQF